MYVSHIHVWLCYIKSTGIWWISIFPQIPILFSRPLETVPRTPVVIYITANV